MLRPSFLGLQLLSPHSHIPALTVFYLRSRQSTTSHNIIRLLRSSQFFLPETEDEDCDMSQANFFTTGHGTVTCLKRTSTPGVCVCIFRESIIADLSSLCSGRAMLRPSFLRLQLLSPHSHIPALTVFYLRSRQSTTSHNIIRLLISLQFFLPETEDEECDMSQAKFFTTGHGTVTCLKRTSTPGICVCIFRESINEDADGTFQ